MSILTPMLNTIALVADRTWQKIEMLSRRQVLITGGDRADDDTIVQKKWIGKATDQEQENTQQLPTNYEKTQIPTDRQRRDDL